MSTEAHAISPAARRETHAPAAIVSFLLVIVTFAVYHRAGSFEFVDLDDGEYVYENAHVISGLTVDNVRWAFTTGHAANWHPLTWISHMLDVELFGLDAGPHHLVNVGIHALNAVILFLLLRALTGTVWRSAAVAALFSVHPLNVENVAWVSERKTLLSMLFGLLAISAYVGWVRRRDTYSFLAAMAFFALSLMSKPMFVTLPLLLLLLDVWPLRRITTASASKATILLREKVPFLVLATISAWVTILAQARSGATASASHFPIGERILNAMISCAWYLTKAVWPASLSMYYPHPSSLAQAVSRSQAIAGGLLIAAITIAALRSLRRQPGLTVGWSWFLVALLPMIGLIQVGSQARADRYAYLPLVGLFLAAVWTIGSFVEHSEAKRAAGSVIVISLVIALGIYAERQAKVWQSRWSLYTHALSIDEHNWMAWNNLGMTCLTSERLDDALHCFARAQAANGTVADIPFNIGTVYSRRQQFATASAFYERALELDPGLVDARVNLGIAQLATGRTNEAAHSYALALKLRPDDRYALYGQALIRLSTGRRDEAAADLARLATVAPDLAAELRARFRILR